MASAVANGSQLQIAGFQGHGKVHTYFQQTKATASRKRPWDASEFCLCGNRPFLHLRQSVLLSLVDCVAHSSYMYRPGLGELHGRGVAFGVKMLLAIGEAGVHMHT